MIISSSNFRLIIALAVLCLALGLSACPGGGNGGAGTAGTATDVSQLYVSGVAGRVLVYNDANTASGSTLPNRTIAGGLTTLNNPRGIAVDMARNHLYVANHSTNSILVFHDARSASGGNAPNRVIAGAPLGGPSALFMDAVGNRLYVANTAGNSILIYDNASTLNGNVAPTRTLSGVATALSGPVGIFVDATRNLLYVVNNDITSPKTIRVFANASSVSGNTAPIRTFSGFSGIGEIFVDVINDRLYLAATGANVVHVFHDASRLSGSGLTPDRTISGGNTLLNQPRDVFVDLSTDRLYVTNAGANAVIVFNGASSVDGNTAPHRTLSLTAATDPWGLFVDVTPMIIGSTASLDGFVTFNGVSYTATSNGGSPRTGDNETLFVRDVSRQFFSFDLSGISSSSTITSANVRLYQASQTGDPYRALGFVLLFDHVNYGESLDNTASDFESGLIELLGVFSTTGSVGYRTRDVTNQVVADLAAGRSRSQYRLRFSSDLNNSNNDSDFVHFTDAEDSCCSVSRPPQLSVILRP